MSARSKVSLVKLAAYDLPGVVRAMRELLEPLGGMSTFVTPGQKVLLKPNVLGPFAPERAVTTHPTVLEAAAVLIQEAGGIVYAGDSPGVGPFRAGARRAGLLDVMDRLGIEEADFDTPDEADVPDHSIVPTLGLAQAVADADVIISLPKLKTHAQMVMTGAVKNQYGLIPGPTKGQWHFRLQNPDWLAKLMIDINKAAKPALAVMDAVVAMEGEGPAGGEPRQVGALLAGTDLVAVDAVACQLIGLEQDAVPILRVASELGFGTTTLDDIDVVGADWQELAVPDFDNVSQMHSTLRLLPLPQWCLKWVRAHWTARPRINPDRCVRCGICARGCPVSPPAIDPFAEPAGAVDDARCIRCYCCHEFCPEKAIDLKRSRVERFLHLDAAVRAVCRKFGRLLAVFMAR